MCTEIVSDIQNIFCTQHVLPMFCKKKSFWQRYACKEIKVETNDLEIEEEIKQEDFVPKDMSETDSDYSPKNKKRKKSFQNKQIKKDKDSEKSINSDSKKKSGKANQEESRKRY